MKIRVTRKFINKGKKKSVESCPIALAIKDRFPGQYVKVYSDSAIIGDARYNLRRGMRFVERFDAGKSVRPVTVELSDLC